ncbi:MAG TPA: glycosyltransferase [Thermoanaerobaculia bacterium]|nr:glycosyltransferase [Thermoanaerobaculia bacterium]
MTTRVTVAIPVYNGARFLAEAIRTLIAQQHATVIVLDDASTDDSVAIARGFDGVRVVENRERVGLAGNWNRALALCESEYLVIAHQDDVYAPRFVERLADMLDRHPRAFAAHCKADTIDEHGRPTRDPAALYKDRFWPRGAPEVEREPEDEIAVLRRGNYVIAPAVMLRMKDAATIGRFDARYDFVTDWDYWLRGLFAGKTLAGLSERLISFRRHAGTATRVNERTLRRYEEELQLLRALEARVPAKQPYRPLENNLLSDFARRLASGDRDGAAALLQFAREHGLGRAGLMRAALAGGRAAGAALQLAQALYVRLV